MKRSALVLPTLVLLGVAVLSAALFFGIPSSGHQSARSEKRSSNSTSPTAPRETHEATTDEGESALSVETTVLPESLRRGAIQTRKMGNPWWAEAIEIGWTRGFAAAVEHLRKFVPPEELDEKSANLLSLLVQEKLELLVEGLPQIHGANQRSMVTSGAASFWARKDPMKLVDFAREHFDANAKNSALKQVVDVLAKNGRFAEAASVLEVMPRSTTRPFVIDHLAWEWGRRDMDGAFAWARALPTEADRIAAERRVISTAHELPLERIRELAAQYGTEKTMVTWTSLMGTKILAADTETAIAWAETLPADSRRRLQQRIAAKLAQSDLARGTAFALHIDNDGASTQAIDEIHRSLDAKAATRWVWTLPEELQHRVVVGIVTRWYRADEEATKSWVASLPFGRVRDRAMMWLAWEIDRSDPVAAANLASQINDAQFKQWAFNELDRKVK